MGLKASIEAAAKAAVLTDAADLQGLVGLGELLRRLATDASAEGSAEIADRSGQAAELAEQIVMRQVGDVDAAFRRLIESISACESASDQLDAPRREPPDVELLHAWIATAMELGATVDDPPRQEPFGAEAWLLDPEANRLLLLVLPAP